MSERSSPQFNPERSESTQADAVDTGRTGTAGATAMGYAGEESRSQDFSESSWKGRFNDRARTYEMQTSGLKERTEDCVRQNPGWSMLLGAAVGFLCSKLILPREQARSERTFEPSMEAEKEEA